MKKEETLYDKAKYYAASYGFGFGIFFGLLFYSYGMYLLFAIGYECECQKVNLASFMENNLNEDCVAFGLNNYTPFIKQEENPQFKKFNRDMIPMGQGISK